MCDQTTLAKKDFFRTHPRLESTQKQKTMFKFLEKAAAKASLVNIKFDLDKLSNAFPNNPSFSSQLLFQLLENVTLALSNNASESDLRKTIGEKSSRLHKSLPPIIDCIVEVALAVQRKDQSAVDRYDSTLCDLFLDATGQQLDVSRASKVLRKYQ